jgi:acetyl/propionyl-CoA carboxylase alpha subunit
MSAIRSVLIANRGEISIRIAKTLRRLGVKVIGLRSVLDEKAAHLSAMDAVLTLDGATVKDSYLNIAQIVDLCVKNQIDAVHPGYGFLSENAEFAQALKDAGVIFMGPNPDAIARMGSKANAKELMIQAGVPTIPGYQGEDQSEATLIAEASRIEWPLLIKASAGGGGKGMRIVREKDHFVTALKAARSEALKSFGDDRVILERYLTRPRHIEFQIFGDSFGNIIHLGERECSIQRRHQKIIEETPSPIMTPALREKMGQAAVACGKILNYSNAGTVEFIVDESGAFYFLEVNTRLQVEHPITEMVTGFDLVEWQWRIAQGEKLPFQQ